MNPEYMFEEFKARWPEMFENVFCGFSLPKGWGPLVWKLCEGLERIKGVRVEVHQVKEKLGGLRFYHATQVLEGAESWDLGWAERLIDAAETASYWVCESCGTTRNVTTEGGWLTTLCGACRSARETERLGI